jgi:predicted metalloprotease with PDZ domain
MKFAYLALTALAVPAAVFAQTNTLPNPVEIPDTIPAAKDVAFPGTIRLAVDATDVTRGIFRMKETIPVSAAGPLTLLYPEWLPGNHAARGPISSLAGIKVSANGKPLSWLRDTTDVYAFHIDVPEGATEITVEYQYLAPTATNQGRIVTTPDMLNLQWNAVALYPAGYYTRGIMIDPSVTLPTGWKGATALEAESSAGATTNYKTVSFQTLVDSPMFAGANVRTVKLSDKVELNIVADRPEQLAATDQQIEYHKNLVAEAKALYGAEHYDHYDFLLALSDRQSGIGLEHHRSSENGVDGDYFTDWAGSVTDHDLLPHEYTHSWNGKYRRPADLWTPDYRTPMRDSGLWVYEGQTQFWGYVLAARSGLLSKEDTLGALASIAATYDTRAGRTWRPLIDTTNDPILSARRPKGWTSWQRSEDYYNEGLLVWLDADSLIRELSHGKKSMDDFARAFFGMNDGDWGELTYTRQDVIDTLNKVQPYDWSKFLADRLDKTSTHAPLEGFTRGGYELVYTDTPTNWFKQNEKSREITDLSYSGGLVIGKDGKISEVRWDSPAFDAGLTVGTKIVAVNGRAYKADDLKATIKAKTSPIELLVQTGDVYRTVKLKYDGGLRYPRLKPTKKGKGSLDKLLEPKR